MLRFIEDRRALKASEDPLQGLLETPPRLSPRYFYDELGSRLFAAITELDEYYPTRLEREIYNAQGEALARSVGHGHTMVDLGAGDCAKAMLLMPHLQPAHYVAIDIASGFLNTSLRRVEADFPDLKITGVATDFADGLDWPTDVECRRPLFFYPGSSIGNFSLPDARRLLRSLSRIGAGSGDGQCELLIGVDLLKSATQLQAAYDDDLGVTASFNLNMLRHLNRLCGSNFDLQKFRHRARFNVTCGRIEMWLVSRCTQRINWPGGSLALREGDAILTEHSYKYAPQDFHRLLHSSGFTVLQDWFDDSHGFMVCHARSLAQ